MAECAVRGGGGGVCHRAPGSPIPHLPWLLVQLVFQSPPPAATDIPSQKSVELWDQLSGVIHFSGVD